MVDTPSHVVKTGNFTLEQLGLCDEDVFNIVASITNDEWEAGGSLDAGIDNAAVQVLARQVAERLVGREYQIQNGNATRGVSQVLSLDGGREHQPLNTEPAFAVRVVGDRGRTRKHCHFQGVLLMLC